MANEEALGPRKTMFVLVIVVGCFAVLWPRILSPLILGSSKDQLKPNQFDRDAGCCEVLFDSEMAILEVLNEICNSVVHVSGKLSPYAAAECRKTVNDTCGVDIAAFLTRDQNVGKTSKKLLDMMKSSNSSCLKEHFGVPILSLSTHAALNSWTLPDSVKQERPVLRGGPGPHPALRERGRAIPPGAPTPPSRGPIPMPAHMRVRSSPLAGYFEFDNKPPPIPGMRPPLGSPGGPVAAPKSSMGFVMPIYTICIIVFFVYTLSKILFKRTTEPYDQVSPDPQFRRRVFRDESRTSPDKLVVTAISGLVAEVQQQMEASYAQSQQTQDVQQDNQARSYTNGTILHSSGPVHIVTSEYQEHFKEKSPEPKPKEVTPEPKEATPEPKEATPEPKEATPEPKEVTPEPKEVTPEPKEPTPEMLISESPEKEPLDYNHVDRKDLLKLSESDINLENFAKKLSDEFLNEARIDSSKQNESKGIETSALLEEALREESPEEQENASVRVLGMEVSAHAADGGTWPSAEPHTHTHVAHTHKPAHTSEQVSSIFLEREIPQQSRVLVADFAEDRDNQPAPVDSPLVVSGKMTLSLIQDEPRDTPDRDIESTIDDFTTASAMTQPVADLTEKQEELPDDEEEVEIGKELEVDEVPQKQEVEEGVAKELAQKEDVVNKEVSKEVVNEKSVVEKEPEIEAEVGKGEAAVVEEVVHDEEVKEEDLLNEEVNKEEALNEEESEEEIEEVEVEEIEVEVTDSEGEEYEQEINKITHNKK